MISVSLRANALCVPNHKNNGNVQQYVFLFYITVIRNNILHFFNLLLTFRNTGKTKIHFFYYIHFVRKKNRINSVSITIKLSFWKNLTSDIRIQEFYFRNIEYR